MTTATVPAISRLVAVNDWSNRRRVEETPESVGLQITVSQCGCGTCRRRFEGVVEFLERKETAYELRLRGNDRSAWVFFHKEESQDGLEVLREVFADFLKFSA